jgi:hypothetical protein
VLWCLMPPSTIFQLCRGGQILIRVVNCQNSLMINFTGGG